jgi:hypothetical protein
MMFANHGPCDYDIPQNLTVSSVYQLPFGKGRRFMASANSVADTLLGGWEAAGILTARSGLPFTPTISGDRANTGVSGQRPIRLGVGTSADPTVSKWFDPSAFAVPAQYTYGNSGRNILRGDGLLEFDMTLKKVFSVKERYKVEFRAEAFNLFNQPTFSNSNATIGTAAAGTVTSTLNANRILQGALKFYF